MKHDTLSRDPKVGALVTVVLVVLVEGVKQVRVVRDEGPLRRLNRQLCRTPGANPQEYGKK